MLHPTSNPTEPEGGLLMDVEGCSGPTAINSSPARSSLSDWWNLPTAAACHTIQKGLQTNASSMCLLYYFAYSQELTQAKSYGVHRKRPSAPVSVLHSQQLCSIASLWDYRGLKKARGFRFTRFTRYKHRGTAASCFTWIKVRISSYTTANLTFHPYLVYLVVKKKKKNQKTKLKLNDGPPIVLYCICKMQNASSLNWLIYYK